MSPSDAVASPWRRVSLAVSLFAVDPVRSGLLLRAGPGPVRDLVIERLGEAVAPRKTFRVPAQIADDRLIGGLDVAATLRAGKPIAELGLLASADNGVLLLAMAERLSSTQAARFASALDTGDVVLQRDGLSRVFPARWGVVALDEGIDDECVPAALADRLPFWCDLEGVSLRDVEPQLFNAREYARAREALPSVQISEDLAATIVETALAVGAISMRATIFTLRAAQSLAALRGDSVVDSDDVSLAAALVLGPRAAHRSSEQPKQEESQSAPPPDQEAESQESSPQDPSEQDPPSEVNGLGEVEERTVSPERSLLASGLLEMMAAQSSFSKRQSREGKSGDDGVSSQRGRPLEPRPGSLSKGKLSVVATLRAAAPWRSLRAAAAPHRTARVIVKPEDFRIVRHRRRRGSTAIFVVDASGSQAIGRLAEAKGAIQLLLADCYVRRDMVALIAFRGATAEVILPPTRSIARARRELLGLPGGGGTPLADGLDAAMEVAEQSRRKGSTPLIVLMTDGRANIGRNGVPGRLSAMKDAAEAARRIGAAQFAVLAIDTSAGSLRDDGALSALAASMRGRHIKLPLADAASVNAAVRQALPR